MEPHEHVDAAQEFLAESDRKFTEGRILQASEMLWGAAAHMVIALSLQRRLPCRNHNAMKNASKILASEQGNLSIEEDFELAEKFHRNFYRGDMEESLVNAHRPRVRRLVETLRALPGTV